MRARPRSASAHSETTPIYGTGFRCRAKSSVKKSCTSCGRAFPAAEAVDLVPGQPQPSVLGDHLRTTGARPAFPAP